jgi:hypothetical protein
MKPIPIISYALLTSLLPLALACGDAGSSQSTERTAQVSAQLASSGVESSGVDAGFSGPAPGATGYHQYNPTARGPQIAALPNGPVVKISPSHAGGGAP